MKSFRKPGILLAPLALAGCQAELPRLQLIAGDFQISFWANLLATGIVAVAIYLLVDSRLNLHEKRRASKSLYLILRQILARLDFLEYWLDQEGERLRKGFSNTYVPERLKSSASELWENLYDPETIKYFPADILSGLEIGLKEVDLCFSALNRTYQEEYEVPEVFAFLRLTRQKALEHLLPVYRVAVTNLGYSENSQDDLRAKALQELIALDQQREALIEDLREAARRRKVEEEPRPSQRESGVRRR